MKIFNPYSYSLAISIYSDARAQEVCEVEGAILRSTKEYDEGQICMRHRGAIVIRDVQPKHFIYTLDGIAFAERCAAGESVIDCFFDGSDESPAKYYFDRERKAFSSAVELSLASPLIPQAI